MKKLLLAALLLVFGTPAHAADPTGVWRMDTGQFEQAMRAAMQAEMGAELDAMDDQMKAMMDGMVNQMVAEMAGVIEFFSDGRVIYRSDDGGEQAGQWQDLGDQIEVTSAASPEPTYMVIDGNTMTSVMTSAADGPPIQMVMHRQ